MKARGLWYFITRPTSPVARGREKKPDSNQGLDPKPEELQSGLNSPLQQVCYAKVRPSVEKE